MYLCCHTANVIKYVNILCVLVLNWWKTTDLPLTHLMGGFIPQTRCPCSIHPFRLILFSVFLTL